MTTRGSVYLAARYDRRDELRGYRKVLEYYGFEVTSRWLDEQEPLDSQMGQHSEEFYRETSKIDLEDVSRANGLIFFSENPLEGFRRGGRHVEFGYALAEGKPIAVVGPRENVFHYTPNVYQFKSFADCISDLKVTKDK